jgi:hypothetical protein
MQAREFDKYLENISLTLRDDLCCNKLNSSLQKFNDFLNSFLWLGLLQ